MTQRTMRKAAQSAVIYVLLTLPAIVFILPLLWLVSTSLKDNTQMAVWPPVWIPNPVRWDNFASAWSGGNFGRYLQNSTFITGVATFGQVATASLVAYGFARLRFPGRDFLFGLVLATLMLPSVATLIPTYVLFSKLRWLDSFKPLIVPAYFGGGPFFVFLLRQFFKTIPNELSEQAKIDGASNYRTYWQIMLPLSKPALATVAIFAFMGHWNDFMGPLIYLNSPEKYTLTLGLRLFMGMNEVRFQEMMAMALMITLPVIAVFFLFQQYFIQGVVMTGIKA